MKSNPISAGVQNMPQRPDELPEGTDHIINGAMETDEGGGGGFVGSASGDDTGGTASGGGGQTMVQASQASGDGSDGQAGGVGDQLRGQVSALRDQATDRARDFAEGGKTRASDALEEL